MDKGDGQNKMEEDPQPGTSRGQKRRSEGDGDDKYRSPKKARGEYTDSDLSSPEFQSHSRMDSGSDMESLAGGDSPPTLDMTVISDLCEKLLVKVTKDQICKDCQSSVEKAMQTVEKALVGQGLIQPVASGSVEQGESSTGQQGEVMETGRIDVQRKDQDVGDDADDEAEDDDEEMS